ncbi:MAG: hypothetical protein II401_10375 [Bacteroidales bacterium]|nr:hypothetical protein [Bacteroidales bacterium]
MENTLSIISKQLPSTKTEQKSFIAQLVDAALKGEVDLLKVHAQMENLKAVIEGYLKDPKVKELEIDEVRKYENDIAEVHNAKFEIASVGVKYDYTLCGHKAYNRIQQQIADLQAKAKQMEEVMKLNKEMWVYTDTETGETYEVYPPTKTGSLSVKITVKK